MKIAITDSHPTTVNRVLKVGEIAVARLTPSHPHQVFIRTEDALRVISISGLVNVCGYSTLIDVRPVVSLNVEI